VIVWDECDYSNVPITNQVTLIVATNDADSDGRASARFYTHFSLLRSIEGRSDYPASITHAIPIPIS
jgi:hypothetical protein